MFDSFTVDRRGAFADPQPDQKVFDDFVPASRLGCKPPSRERQFDRLVGFRQYQAIPLQPLDRVVDRRVGDTELLHQINRSANAMVADRLGDRFDVVFGHLIGMVRSGALVNFAGQCCHLGVS